MFRGWVASGGAWAARGRRVTARSKRLSGGLRPSATPHRKPDSSAHEHRPEEPGVRGVGGDDEYADEHPCRTPGRAARQAAEQDASVTEHEEEEQLQPPVVAPEVGDIEENEDDAHCEG